MTLATLAKYTCATILGIFFVNVGIAHFTDTPWFEPIVPELLGDPTFWVLLTGILEIGLGIGLVIPQLRKYSGLFMAFFLVVIYWANFNMWANDTPLDGRTFADFWHVMRLIAQVLMITVALWVGGWFTSREKFV